MISTPKRFAGLAAAVLAAGALAACSSSSTSSPAAGSSSCGDPRVRRDAAHRRRLGPRPPRHRALVLHDGLPAHACLHPAAPELSDLAVYQHLRPELDEGRHADRGHGDRGAEHRQRRDHQRREDLHVPHQAGRGLEHQPAAPGHVRGRFLREFKAFFNPVSPVGNPVYYESTIAGLTAYANAETAYFANKSHAPTAANITTSRTRTTSRASRRRTRRRCRSR